MKKQLCTLSLLFYSFAWLSAQNTNPFDCPFPSALSIAHTWNRSLVKRAGQVIGASLHQQGATTVALPNLTVIECPIPPNCLPFYGESPYLVAELGVEMVKGLQAGEQLKSVIVIAPKEEKATYVSPYQRVLAEANPKGGTFIDSLYPLMREVDSVSAELSFANDYRQVALQIALESIVLLKNEEEVLPINTSKVKIIGIHADEDIAKKIIPVLQTKLNTRCKVIPLHGPAEEVDMIISFQQDDTCVATIEPIAALKRPIVLVLLNTHPISVQKISPLLSAIVEVWHPGKQGAEAIAAILTGEYNPGGKLTLSFPEFAVGHGLSYTTFQYSNLSLTPQLITTDGDVIVTFNVTNTGKHAGSEVAQVYLGDKLEAFKRTNIKAGETKELKFTIRQRNMKRLTSSKQWVVEPGMYQVRVGGSCEDIRLKNSFNVIK